MTPKGMTKKIPWGPWKEYPGMFHATLPSGGSYYTWTSYDGTISATYSPPWRSPYPAKMLAPPRPRLIHKINAPTELGFAKSVEGAKALCEAHYKSGRRRA